MTNEQINIAIAEACGWTDISKYTQAVDGWYGYEPENGPHSKVPDYCNDLNAMHEAEKVLTPKYQPAKGESQWGEYLGWLGFCGENKTREVYECVTATAAQRADAFLRTLDYFRFLSQNGCRKTGKWEEA